MDATSPVSVTKNDLLAAWAVLENLAVSLDQIGGKFGRSQNTGNGIEKECAFQEALAAYLTPELVKSINQARIRLGQYLSEEEAEALVESIPYWNYAAASKIGR